MKHDTSAAGQHAEPDRKPVVPPSVRWKKCSATTRCSNTAGNAATVYAGSRARRTLSGICFQHSEAAAAYFGKRWRPKKYVHFTVCERGKIRGIDAPHITDRQIHKVISKEVLEPLYDPSMIYDNGASRIGKGLHWQIKRIKQQLARHYRKYGRAGGVLLLDLKKFFPYAPHSIIYQRHQRYILNPDFRRIADTIIDTAPGEFPGRGMPLGVEPSQQEMAAMPSAVDNWIKCQMSTHSAGHYMDDYCIILPDIEDLKKLGRAIVRQFEIRGIPVNKKKCKIIPLTKPFRWCKARFTLTETGKIKVNGSRDGVIRARRKLKLFHREWRAGKRTLQEVAQYMNCQEAYYKNFDDHGRLLRLRRLCYAILEVKYLVQNHQSQ